MASFIDNVIVGTEEKKEYDKVVKEVVKRLVENNLYIKPEKCKWKIRKIGFLRVVIKPEGIRIKKEKMKDILDWLILKEVQDV